MKQNTQEIQTVAVIGCGFIGYSWGIVFARAGLRVHMYNRKSPTLDSVKDRMREGLTFLAEEKVIEPEEVEAAINRVQTFDDLKAAVKDADYIQECMWEDLPLKQRIFRELTELTDPSVPIGSSCSGLMISDITSQVTNGKERCVVAHPTNPPHLIPFMEISGDKASPQIKDRVFHFMESVGQKPIQCREVYGYVLNRLQLSLIQEALYLVKEGICDVPAVDQALTDGLGLRWAFTGPYGVEELNSAGLGEGLEKYKDYMIEFFTEHQQKVLDYDQDFVENCVRQFRPVMNGMDHKEYLLWRDRMVTRARKLKE